MIDETIAAIPARTLATAALMRRVYKQDPPYGCRLRTRVGWVLFSGPGFLGPAFGPPASLGS